MENQKFGLLGYPLGHSLSPAIHNCIYKHYGIHASYKLYETEIGRLPNIVEELRASNIKGINVTIPYKEMIIKSIDRLDDVSYSTGAVNTVLGKDGILEGYNTDFEGFKRSLQVNGIDVYQKDVFVIGAGGAAKSIVYCLLEKCSNVHIFGRDMNKAGAFACFFKNSSHIAGVHEIKDLQYFIQFCKPFMIINCTPIGMKGYGGSLPLSLDTLWGSARILYDLVYNPGITEFLSLGKKCGCCTVSGMDMLILQAFESIRIWTGERIDFGHGKKLLDMEGILKIM